MNDYYGLIVTISKLTDRIYSLQNTIVAVGLTIAVVILLHALYTKK